MCRPFTAVLFQDNTRMTPQVPRILEKAQYKSCGVMITITISTAATTTTTTIITTTITFIIVITTAIVIIIIIGVVVAADAAIDDVGVGDSFVAIYCASLHFLETGGCCERDSACVTVLRTTQHRLTWVSVGQQCTGLNSPDTEPRPKQQSR